MQNQFIFNPRTITFIEVCFFAIIISFRKFLTNKLIKKKYLKKLLLQLLIIALKVTMGPFLPMDRLVLAKLTQ